MDCFKGTVLVINLDISKILHCLNTQLVLAWVRRKSSEDRSQLTFWLALNSFIMTPHSSTPSCSGFRTWVDWFTCKYVSSPLHLDSCSIPLTPTEHSAAARPFPLRCQSKYHSFIWSCAGPWEESLTPAWASPPHPSSQQASSPRMGTRILTSPVSF